MRTKFKKIVVGDWADWAAEIQKNNPVDYSNENNIEMPCDKFNPVNCQDKLWKEWGLIGRVES